MEIVHTSEYPSFISSLLGCFVELLRNRLTPQVCVFSARYFLLGAHVVVEKPAPNMTGRNRARRVGEGLKRQRQWERVCEREMGTHIKG